MNATTLPTATRLQRALEQSTPTESGHRWASSARYLALLAPGESDPTVSAWSGRSQALRFVLHDAPELRQVRRWKPETEER